MPKPDVEKKELYKFIKNNNYHHTTDKDRMVVLLRKKFSNPLEEMYEVLEDAMESNDVNKVILIDKKYSYTGPLSGLHKSIK